MRPKSVTDPFPAGWRSRPRLFSTTRECVPKAWNVDTAAIEEATGPQGQFIPEERVFKVTKPGPT